MSAAAELAQIAKEIAVCTKCDLCKTRTKTVPGEGNPNPSILFIGEAPGYNEDMQGRPFVGDAGKLLDKLLNAISIPREDVFIGNVIKCRPPKNQDPTDEQIEACRPYLDRQIVALDPRLIVTLGRFSMRRYWPGQRISQIHGQPKQENGRMIMPMFHPAAALWDQSKRTLGMFKEDGLTIPAVLAKAEEIARTELWGQPTQEAHSAQPILAETAAPPDYSPLTVARPVEVPVPIIPAEIIENDALPISKSGSEEPGLTAETAEFSSEPALVAAKVRSPRRVKPEAGVSPTPVVPAINDLPKPAVRSRKKRQPVEGEQLTMF